MIILSLGHSTMNVAMRNAIQRMCDIYGYYAKNVLKIANVWLFSFIYFRPRYHMQHAMIILEIHEFSMLVKMRQSVHVF